MEMNFFVRDDIQSLLKRKQGDSIVCATVSSENPIEISDQSGKMVISRIPPDEHISSGDTCLLLFECCSDKAPSLKRVTLTPEELTPLYHYLLCEFRKTEHQLNVYPSPVQTLIDSSFFS